ncbi:MAG: hypothetical protein IJ905_11845 [Fibrobacter sp.]|nr:hypothetical protein [Fibrobacter sp.]
MMLKKEDLFEKKISYCLNAKATQIWPCSVRSALEEIQSEAFKDKISDIRCAVLDEEKKCKKRNLKGYLFSGYFERRSKDALLEYSKICVLDFDKVGDVDSVKKEIFENEYVFAVWVSPSGNGIKALIVFDYSAYLSESNIDYVNLHKEAFKQFNKKNSFSCELDTSGCDVARLCFTSSDPSLKIKDEFKTFPVEFISTKKIKSVSRLKKKIIKALNKKMERFDDIDALEAEVVSRQNTKSNRRRHVIKSICRYLCKRKMSITPTYADWFLIGQALANIFSFPLAKKYYLKLCELDGIKHDEIASRKKLVNCYSQIRGEDEPKAGLKTIMDAARKKGWINRG